MLRSEDIISGFGQSADSADLEVIFQELNTLRRPTLEDEDEISYFDWVLVKRKGIELGFADSAYLNAEPSMRWGHGELIFCQVYFYSSFDGISQFEGELPFNLTFSDNRSTARQKLQRHESSRRSWKSDTWVLADYNTTVIYSEKTGLVERVSCRKPPAPIVQSRSVKWPDVTEIISAIGGPTTDLGKLFDQALLDTALNDDEIDLSQDVGMTIHLANGGAAPALVQAITFHANRDVDSTGWPGALPLNLNFDDSPEILRKKIGERPTQESDSLTTGHGIWHFPEYTLHVLYSNFDNCLLRVTIRAPGTWKCIDDS